MSERCGALHPELGIPCEVAKDDPMHALHWSPNDGAALVWDNTEFRADFRMPSALQAQGPTPQQMRDWANNAREGARRKAEGQAQALDNIDITSWKDAFNAALRSLADLPEPFTSEDVIAIVGLPTGEVGTNANNAVGAMMTAAATRELIYKIDRVPARRPNSHGAEITLWIGARFYHERTTP